MKQGWGQVPYGHWIITDSQVNSLDENTAVDIYYQMPFPSNQNKVLLLQQVPRLMASATTVATAIFLLLFYRLLNLLCFRP
jgi:hypothetical protein